MIWICYCVGMKHITITVEFVAKVADDTELSGLTCAIDLAHAIPEVNNESVGTITGYTTVDVAENT